jgi:hypothetical protein
MPFFDIRVAIVLLMAAAGTFSSDKGLGADPAIQASPAAMIADSAAMDALIDEAAAVITSDIAGPALSAFDAAAWDLTTIGAVDHDVFSLALSSAEKAVARGEAAPATLTVIDFSVPSTERRMFVYDLRSRALLFAEHVSHGRNSGDNVPTMFSNQPESFKSSIGLYRTGEGYFGKHGYSLRLDGLEKGFNDRARERAIVIHGADYVNAEAAKTQGRLGRSLGCPALRPAIATRVIDTVKDGGLVFAYYPDAAWLASSTYLN